MEDKANISCKHEENLLWFLSVSLVFGLEMQLLWISQWTTFHVTIIS